MKKAGFIVSLVSVIFGAVFDLIIAVTAMQTGDSRLIGIGVVTLVITSFLIFAMMHYKKGNGWVISLLVLGAITILTSLQVGQFNITGVGLVVGTILTLVANSKEATEKRD